MADLNDGRTAPLARAQMPILWALILWSFVGVGLGLVVEVVFAQMAAGTWIWEGPLNLDSTRWFDVTRSAITTVGIFGLGGAALLAYRRQHTSERQHTLDERKQLAVDRTDLRGRYTTAAEQIGHDKAAVRLAGVYAMAALADDWSSAGDPEQRQVCVNVLCSYLRMDYDPKSEGAETGEREVRETIIKVITSHLQDPLSISSWCGMDLDFSGVVFEGANFTRAHFTGGYISFAGAEFIGGAFVTFAGAEFAGAYVSFGSAQFAGGHVYFPGAKFTGGTVDFAGAQITGGAIYFNRAKFSGANVDFDRAEFTGGSVDFDGAEFTAGDVSFIKTSGGKLPTLSFENVASWQRPPRVPWDSRRPPAWVLPKSWPPRVSPTTVGS